MVVATPVDTFTEDETLVSPEDEKVSVRNSDRSPNSEVSACSYAGGRRVDDRGASEIATATWRHGCHDDTWLSNNVAPNVLELDHGLNRQWNPISCSQARRRE